MIYNLRSIDVLVGVWSFGVPCNSLPLHFGVVHLLGLLLEFGVRGQGAKGGVGGFPNLPGSSFTI